MVKLINPLCSSSAAGRLGGLIYESGRYGPYVKAHTPQRGKPTEAQLQQNYFFGVACDEWRELTEEQKEEYNIRARTLKMTGFNLYIKENIQHP